MTFVTKQLSTAVNGNLNHYIQSVMMYTFETNQAIQFNPEGCIELIFQLNGTFNQRLATSDEWMLRPNHFIGGLHNQSYFVKAGSANSRCLSFKLSSTFASQLFNNLNEYKNQIVNLTDVWSLKRRNTLQQLLDTPSAEHIKVNLLDFFKAQINEITPQRVYVDPKPIHQSQGRINIKDLAKSVHLSESHYRKLFREQIGLSPQEYCKVIRVKHAIKQLQGNKYNQLTELALSLGYFDQSHFIREFKSITQVSPKEFNLASSLKIKQIA